MSAYQGDTPAKKIARLVVYKRIKALLGPRFLTDVHVVLLSPKMGDIPVLLGLGVHPENIIGVDIDKHAVNAAKHKYPNVQHLHTDVAAAMRQLYIHKRKIGSVFLDYCNSLGDHTVYKAIEVTEQMNSGSVLAIAVKMGRENGEWAKAVNAAKEKFGDTSPFLLRADLLTYELLTKANGHRFRAKPIDFIRYKSERSTGEMSEMMVCIAQLSQKQELKEDSLKVVNRIIKEAHISSITASYLTIGSVAAKLAAAGEDPQLLLNIRGESIPPYKAHLTRGTYRRVPSPVKRKKAN